jgi:two-component system C4-dicarboxylate transport response regulator DctD
MKGQKDQASENKYILAVDDDSDIVAMVGQALQLNGFKVSAFTDPAMALEDFKRNCKDCGLILSDIRMPEINGYELIRKAKEIDKQVKVVLMSAFEINDGEFHNLLPDIKVDAFLQKPFSIQQLNDTIRKINNVQ